MNLDDARRRAQEARERAEAATPGPWRHRNEGVDDGADDWVADTTNEPVAAYRFWWSAQIGPDLRREDADFIAHARTDVPQLASIVEALAGEVEQLRGNTETDHPDVVRVLLKGECDKSKYYHGVWRQAEAEKTDLSRRLDAAEAEVVEVLDQVLEFKRLWNGGEPNYPAWLDSWPEKLAKARAALSGERKDGGEG